MSQFMGEIHSQIVYLSCYIYAEALKYLGHIPSSVHLSFFCLEYPVLLQGRTLCKMRLRLPLSALIWAFKVWKKQKDLRIKKELCYNMQAGHTDVGKNQEADS